MKRTTRASSSNDADYEYMLDLLGNNQSALSLNGYQGNVDGRAGTVVFEKKDSDWELYATPFFDGSSELPISVMDTETGDYETLDEISFKVTGDQKKDLKSYLDVVGKTFNAFLKKIES